MALKIWPQLPEHLQTHIVSFLSPNDIACTVRLLNKSTATYFNSPEHKIVRLSQPVPQHSFKQQWGSTSSALQALDQWQRSRLICLTAQSGILENLKLVTVKTGSCDAFFVQAAAGAGHLHICQWLADEGIPLNGVLDSAAEAGHRHVCEWAIKRGANWEESAVYAAAKGGHVDIVDWLLLQCPYTVEDALEEDYCDFLVTSLLRSAVAGCDLATLQRLWRTWLRVGQQDEEEGGGDWAEWREAQEAQQEKEEESNVAHDDFSESLLSLAICSPTPDWQAKVEWLEQLGYPRTSEACCEVAARLDIAESRLRWLRQRGYPMGVDVVTAAARVGNMPALRYLLEEAGVRVAGSKRPAYVAAFHGQLEALKYLLARAADQRAGDQQQQQQETPGGEEPDTWEEHRGYVPGLSSSKEPVWAAALSGQVAVLRYLLDEAGVQLSAPVPLWKVVQSTSAERRLVALQFLHERGYLTISLGDVQGSADDLEQDQRAVDDAVAVGSPELATWLLQTLGLKLRHEESVVANKVIHGDVPMLARLQALGLRFGREALRQAVKSRQVEVVRWLVEDGGCSLEADADDLYLLAADVCGNPPDPLFMMRCLRRLGCPFTANTLTRFVRELMRPLQGPLGWLVEEGCPVDWEGVGPLIDVLEGRYQTDAAVWLRAERDRRLKKEGQQGDGQQGVGQRGGADVDGQGMSSGGAVGSEEAADGEQPGQAEGREETGGEEEADGQERLAGHEGPLGAERE